MLDARKLPKSLRLLVKDIRTTAKEHNVTIILSDKRSVGDEKQCNGYFEDGDNPTLAVACGQPFRQWILVLLHESCHMDQWIEQIPLWGDAQVQEYEVMDVVDLWCDGLIELNKDQLNKYIALGREIELDCEKRAVEKIKKYNLRISTEEYIQKANAYVWFYTMIKHTRKWYKIGREPYNVKKVWTAMPKEFLDDYDSMPDNIYKLFESILR